MEKVRAFLARKNITFSAKRYFIDAMSAMAQGLFCTLLVGTILDAIGKQFGIGFLTDTFLTIKQGDVTFYFTIGGFCSLMVGPAMAVAIGKALEAPPLVLFSLITVALPPMFWAERAARWPCSLWRFWPPRWARPSAKRPRSTFW